MEQVEWAMLQSLVGLSENEELEFKSQMWPRNRNEEVARDIAQFAGKRGGLLIVGARETDGKLEELTPLQISESDELRIQQIVDSLISPRPTIHMRRVVANGRNAATAGSILLISVPDSRLKPHAVQEGSRLSYPIRSGGQKRYLSEPEVADHYALRLKNRNEAQASLDALMESASAEIGKPGSHRTALVCAAVPEQPGQGELQSDTARKIQAYTLESFVPQAEWNLSTARADFRSVCFGPETGSLVTFKFCVDGSGFAIEPLDSGDSGDLYAERVAISALNCVSLFGRHAVESEAAGSLLFAFRIVDVPGREVGLRTAAAFGGSRWRITRLPTVIARRDFSAEALAAGGRDLLDAWEQVATDLMSPFDFASPIPRNDAGELSRNSYLRHWRGDFERLGMPIERA
ncbi:MAG: ATP-binding protein [Acidimicrobiaceae bacterium]|nr:ATP-binding protein [Acidimicrobiaceae bacterium]